MTRLVVPIDDEIPPMVAANFGRAAAWWVHDGAHSEVVANAAAHDPGGAGIKAAQQVIDLRPDVLIAPRLGENAAKVLRAAGVELRRSAPGPAEELVDAYARGALDELTDFRPGQHGAGA